jgi:hypothetical protein
MDGCISVKDTQYIGKRDLVYRQKRPTDTGIPVPINHGAVVTPSLSAWTRFKRIWV